MKMISDEFLFFFGFVLKYFTLNKTLSNKYDFVSRRIRIKGFWLKMKKILTMASQPLW